MKSQDFKDQLKGQWALVTVGSEGIGREFAHQLAGLGMNLVIVARTESKLRLAEESLKKQFDCKVLVITEDLTDPFSFARILEKLKQNSIKVKILVNNAGVGALNVKAPVLLSQLLFEDLRNHDESAIINVSSIAAYKPTPYMSVYAATKSFLMSFSQGLWAEWGKHGIRVQTLAPKTTDTESSKKPGNFQTTETKDTAETVVRQSLRALFAYNQKIVVPVKGTLFSRILAKILPAKVWIRQVAKIFNPKSV